MRTHVIVVLSVVFFGMLNGCGGVEDASGPDEISRNALDGDGGLDGGDVALDGGDVAQDATLASDAGCAVSSPTPPPPDSVDSPELSGSGCGVVARPAMPTFADLMFAFLALVLLRKRKRVAAVAALMLLVGSAHTAGAQGYTAPGFALDRFDPATRGSQWFAADDLNLSGELRPTLGLTTDYADAPLVIRSRTSNANVPLVSSQLVEHFGASFVLVNRVRFGLDMPLVLASQVHPGALDGFEYAPVGGVAPGDMAIAADVRVLGEPDGRFTLALGARLYAATGSTSAFASDGRARAALRGAVAGAVGHLRYALSVQAVARPSDPSNAMPVGSGANLAMAVGWQSGRVRFGPELIASEDRTSTARVVSAPGASAEALMGAHVQLGAFVVGMGAGPGLTHGVGTPSWRGLLSIDWSPPPEVKPILDSDGDGIIDSRDACPDVAGKPDPIPSRNGCPHPPPDRDRDGIPDAQDACPDQPGPAAKDPTQNGCPVPPPDRDGDGIPDAEDACPDVSGLVNGDPKRNGCPLPDRDNDGVPDIDDECPDTPGIPELGGCPGSDRDGDGVADRLDNCPDQAGPASNQGCPANDPQFVAITRQRLVLRAPVAFVGATAKLEPKSEALLDQVARVLKNHPEIVVITVEGHADLHPLADANQKLSTARAEAVVHHLTQHGVAKARLQARGYGSTQPLVDRDGSAEARDQNSRIELRFFAVLR